MWLMWTAPGRQGRPPEAQGRWQPPPPQVLISAKVAQEGLQGHRDALPPPHQSPPLPPQQRGRLGLHITRASPRPLAPQGSSLLLLPPQGRLTWACSQSSWCSGPGACSLARKQRCPRAPCHSAGTLGEQKGRGLVRRSLRGSFPQRRASLATRRGAQYWEPPDRRTKACSLQDPPPRGALKAS